MTNINILVGERIKERRTALKMSQRSLAEIMEYSNHSTIARIEAGAVDIPQSKIMRFAEVLHTTPAHLMGWDREPEDQAEIEAEILTDPELMDMIMDYRKMSAEKKKALRQMAKALASD